MEGEGRDVWGILCSRTAHVRKVLPEIGRVSARLGWVGENRRAVKDHPPALHGNSKLYFILRCDFRISEF